MENVAENESGMVKNCSKSQLKKPSTHYVRYILSVALKTFPLWAYLAFLDLTPF